ncbi:hypothetical protein KBZ20_16360 [Vulcanococcus limneticus Candia 3F8]|uniref:hypothetical protein n=1 Tax=Vulcanococcus limneticus TaxID=2170428 RepID=UPI0020CBB0B2|nr:hypothetical protein [Vulcanococcus limneticus]MCP9793338.1 hypothetical protein [Vulcanococcus limneticus MW73D5]MCP9895340.1 hypothetical protein [Vulcanococcus limneticus Candia 3F8]MCP9898736.1 hypothetical protein [Vulcanococcus limneticus Candia 3B3]
MKGHTLYPVRLLLPDSTRRRGAIKARDWDTGLAFALRQYPGATVERLELPQEG